MSILARPRVRQWGWVVLFGALCFGAGNFHATQAAVDGSARWWEKRLGRTLTTQHWQDQVACYTGKL